MDKIHIHKAKKSICAHFAESPCISIYKRVFMRLHIENNNVNFIRSFMLSNIIYNHTAK